MRNCNVALSLAVGFIIAAASSHDGKQFVTSTKISQAPTFALLWVSAGGTVNASGPLGYDAWPHSLLGYMADTIMPLRDTQCILAVNAVQASQRC
jgi:hypothetical protein